MLDPFAKAIDLLATIPGGNRRSAEVYLSEFGADMGRFGSANRLASWAGMCPGNNESAGKHFSGKTRKGSKWLRTALVESAEAAARMKGVIAYHVLSRGESYKELGGDYFIERQRKGAYQSRLVKQLERMGYDVTLTEKAA